MGRRDKELGRTAIQALQVRVGHSTQCRSDVWRRRSFRVTAIHVKTSRRRRGSLATFHVRSGRTGGCRRRVAAIQHRPSLNSGRCRPKDCVVQLSQQSMQKFMEGLPFQRDSSFDRSSEANKSMVLPRHVDAGLRNIEN